MKTKFAVFAGGCFWCTEAVFKSIKGIIKATPGYSGGDISNPTYEEVSGGETGHAEAVKIEYDPEIISYADLLTIFFNTHDPTTLNKQGNDTGPQYRSVVFYNNEEEKVEAEKFIEELNISKAFDNPIVTKVEPYQNFFEAEDYHKDYYERHKDEPYCAIVIAPKLKKLRTHFTELLK